MSISSIEQDLLNGKAVDHVQDALVILGVNR
jgi:hypothetical protein